MDRDLGRYLLDPETRSPDPAVCPFLRAVAPSADGAPRDLLEPYDEPHDDNRCLAAGPVEAQGIAQQRAVCLTADHVACGRYLRGAAAEPLPPIVSPVVSAPLGSDPMEEPILPTTLVAHGAAERPDAPEGPAIVDEPGPAAWAGRESDAAGTGPRPPVPVAFSPGSSDAAAGPAPGDYGPGLSPARAGEPRRVPSSPRGRHVITPAVLVAMAILVGSAGLAVAFVAAHGGLELPSASSVAAASVTPEPTGLATAPPTPAPTPAVTPEPTAPLTAPPTSAPIVTPEPTLPPTPTPAPTSNRYAVLVPCPSTPGCYLYTIRAGDNLRSIAHWFGVPYSTVLSMNPQIIDAALIQPGDVIKLPPPTR